MTRRHASPAHRAPVLLAGAALALLAAPAGAVTLMNVGPPPGGKVLIDMSKTGTAFDRTSGEPVATITTARFVATSTQTRLSIAMRSDYQHAAVSQHGGGDTNGARLFVDNLAVGRVDPQGGGLSVNLFYNGDFDLNPDNVYGAPLGWILDEPPGYFIPSGRLSDDTPIVNPLVNGPDGFPVSVPNFSFESLANNNYNALSQTIATIPGATYEVRMETAFISFHERFHGHDYTDYIARADYDFQGRQLVNGLNAMLIAYDAGPGTHDDGHMHFAAVAGEGGAVPEPATWALMLAGFGGSGAALRRRRRRVAATA